MAKERRRRAYLPAGIVILAVLGGGQYYLSNIFAPADTGSGGNGGTGGVPGADVPLHGPANPAYAVSSVYAAVGNDDPGKVCQSVLGGIGGVHFAGSFSTTSCEDAVHKEHKKVTDSETYASITVPLGAIHEEGTSSATVYSCAMPISGGDPLGTFVLTRTDNGWIIVDNKPDPGPCPPADSH
ncbi:hypothetical protein [Kutzneria kofuensis]|uniref:Uncharacterized protein n=1 Tax=Kutzneria kofuensis TaxID=103725 RepID=A0A7W9KIH3_9PSEU|nr:hypothetical protein [Kutzneria kofuensis]MBB5893218.1 hypothetical protein [Kutzneria kofuensis]